MKKIFTYLVLFVITVLSAKAQIPNPSFENWTSNEPDGWITDNSGFPGLVTQSANAHSGNSAVRFNVESVASFSFGGTAVASADQSNAGFPVASAPAALHGWYIFHSTSANEYFSINAAVQLQGTGVGVGSVDFTGNASVYTEFVIDLFYPGSMSVDTGQITCGFGVGGGDSLRVSTYFILDDLAYGPASTVGISEVNNSPGLESCSPNPANEMTNVFFRTTGSSKVSAAFYDMVGNKIQSVLEETEVPSGRHKVPTDLSKLANGIYLCCLTINGQSYSQKILVAR